MSTTLSWLQVSWGALDFKGKFTPEKEETWACSWECLLVSLSWGFLNSLLWVGTPENVSRDSFSRMFISFPSVSFNMLMYQKEQVHGGGIRVIFRSALPLSWICLVLACFVIFFPWLHVSLGLADTNCAESLLSISLTKLM